MEFLGDLRDRIGRDKLTRQADHHLTGQAQPFLALTRNKKDLYVPYEKQAIFHKAHHYAFETLYGGAAGGGKTQAMLWDAYMYCIQHPGCRVILFRRTFPQLEKSLIFYSRMCFDSTMGKYSTQHKSWVIYTSGKPSYLEFGHCKSEGDVYDYHSAQYDGMYFDELSHFTEFQYTYLLTRIRPNVEGTIPFVKCASNPGGIGHAWVRRRFRLWDKTIWFQAYRPDKTEVDVVAVPSRSFIPAFVTDNLYIMKNDPGYIERLRSSPFAKQLLDGDWGIFTGQAFSEFELTKHTCQSFDIPVHWNRYISLDYGYSRPFSAHWYAEDSSNHRIYCYRELYGAGLRDAQQAMQVMSLSAPAGVPEKFKNKIADPSVFTPRGTGSSIAQVWEQNGLTVSRGNRDRVAGKARVHDYLSKAPDGKPWIVFFADKCPHMIRTLPEMCIDDKNPEDVATTGEDHCYSPDTEILTNNGWKKFQYLSEEDDVATLSDGYEIVYQKPDKIIELDYNGKMCCHEKQQLNFKVTENHKMVLISQTDHKINKTQKWSLRTIGDMYSIMHIPRSGCWNGKNKEYISMPEVKIKGYKNSVSKIETKKFLRFLGFWLAEGCANKVTTHYRIIVDQKNREVGEKIVSDLPFRYNVHFPPSGVHRFTINSMQLWAWFSDNDLIGKYSHNKHIPRWILSLGKEYLECLYEGMMLGDGTKDLKYDTASKQLADDFQELLLKIGKVGNIHSYSVNNTSQYVMGKKIKKSRPTYRVGIIHNNFSDLKKSDIKTESYCGKVYCVTVPKYHTLFVRRNGIPMWCGNCYDDLRYFLMSLSFNIKNVNNDPELSHLDDVSRQEWTLFRRRCKEMSRDNNKASDSDIHNINA
jgi:intein/homing endonuclease